LVDATARAQYAEGRARTLAVEIDSLYSERDDLAQRLAAAQTTAAELEQRGESLDIEVEELGLQLEAGEAAVEQAARDLEVTRLAVHVVGS
jgi:chromosome segregation ATPase